jgi:hypothetical protein
VAKSFGEIRDCDGTTSNKNTLMVVTFLIVVVDFLTVIPSCLLLQKKKKKKGKKTPNLIFHFVQICYGIYGVKWVRGGGIESSYSYSKTLNNGKLVYK